MTWSIAEVARMSGVTSRTLRHYDEIGLLPPAGHASSGHRLYGEAELLRLQQILLLRELDLGLREIAGILGRQADRTAVLREHHRRLLAERDRLDTLARTVGRTIDALESERSSSMTRITEPENLFEGFDFSAHEAEAERKWPEEAAQAQRYADTLTAEDWERMRRETTEQLVRMARLMAAGRPADDAAVQEEVDAHYRAIRRSWTPSAAAFVNLARTYVDDPQWRSAYDTVAQGLAEYQRDAMTVYAEARLD
ncbi:MerR family transcriptional regulator [Streptomyces oceani]|uniref:MerR family transcriptional regulator n=1 Tax=Streptomyces oceani TaxID=1075402 RepID=A0A1E7JF49_9ACTN|nr:MerR family transcriptional regulator [Streptomyces oceani]OEU85096.1 MerR family transcriptional regulator [Streptomyces oceani]